MGAYDPRSVTVVIDDVTLPMPQLLLADPHAEAMLRARSRAVVEVAHDPDVARRLRAAILGGDLSVSGRLWRYGDRGCFHEGCDATTEPEEGGSHWCRWAA